MLAVDQDLSVVIVAHIRDRTGFEKLLRTMRSIASELHLVTVIDNASQTPWSIRIREAVENDGGRYVRREANNLGAARDQALHLSEGEFLAFVDADIELPRNWLRTMREFLKEPENEACWGVASALVGPFNSKFDRAMALALSTPLAHLGTSQAIRLHSQMTVAHLATAAVLFRRQPVMRIGGFSARFSRVGEDLELSYRIARSPESDSRKLVLLPQPVVTHHQDESLKSWVARVFCYGWGQIEVARIHWRHMFSRKLIPFLVGVLGLVSFGLAIAGQPMLLALLAIQYVTTVFGIVAGGALVSNSLSVVPNAVVIVMATHLAYITGMWAGALGLCRNPRYSASR